MEIALIKLSLLKAFITQLLTLKNFYLNKLITRTTV